MTCSSRLRLAALGALLGIAGSAAAAEAPKTAAARSLDAIRIEGVVDGPEVLFINAREPARLETAHGWELLEAAGLLGPALPPSRHLEATERPEALVTPVVVSPTTTEE